MTEAEHGQDGSEKLLGGGGHHRGFCPQEPQWVLTVRSPGKLPGGSGRGGEVALLRYTQSIFHPSDLLSTETPLAERPSIHLGWGGKGHRLPPVPLQPSCVTKGEEKRQEALVRVPVQGTPDTQSSP